MWRGVGCSAARRQNSTWLHCRLGELRRRYSEILILGFFIYGCPILLINFLYYIALELNLNSEIAGSHDREYGDGCLLDCCTV
jgi:hypothetical protein